MAKNRSRKDLVSGEILERAAELFARRGFSGTSLQEVADAMGMSRPALYHYVANKEDLLAQLVQGITRASADRLAQIRADETTGSVEKLEAVIGFIAVSIINSPARFRLLIMSEAHLPERVAQEHQAARREVLEHLSAIIGQGIDAGVLKPLDERVAALSILGMCNWVAWWYRPGHEMSADEIVALITTIALDGLKRNGARLPKRNDDSVGHALDILRQDLSYLERLIR
jgi:AcrR family transcriptional regulator